MTTPADPTSPMGPPGASPFGNIPGFTGGPLPAQPTSPASKNMQLWQKFLGEGATPEEVKKFQDGFLNAVTQQFKKEADKSRERRKKDARAAEGND